MKTFIVTYLLMGQSNRLVHMVQACNKEHAQSITKRMYPNCSTATAKEA